MNELTSETSGAGRRPSLAELVAKVRREQGGRSEGEFNSSI